MVPPRSSAVTVPPAGQYAYDIARSTITFHTRHMFGLGSVRGSFRLDGGGIEVAEPIGRSTAHADIAADSFTTGSKARDGMVRSAKYLDTEKHQSIRFVSRELAHKADGWLLNGTVAVRDVERPVQLTIEHCHIVDGDLNIRAATRIDRFEFGITAQRGMTGRHLDLTLDIVARSAEAVGDTQR